MNGAKLRPFNGEAAVRGFNHWAYAAAMMNANAKANIPKRLYALFSPGNRYSYAARSVGKDVKKFFNGEYCLRPPLAMMQKVAQYGGEIIEIIEPHPALTVLQNVNPFQNGYELEQLETIDEQTCGNAYWHVVMDPALGIPMELWRMPPQWTEVIPDKKTFLRGYLYGHGREQKRTFGIDEVIHFKAPNPRDVFYGMGWFEGTWAALGLHDAKREMDTARADNYARPDWLLSIESGSPEQTQRLQDHLNEQFRGTRNTGKPIVTNKKVTAQALNWDEKEYGTPTRLIEEIAAGSGVPVAMLLSNDPNRANSEQSRLTWYRNTIKAYCQRAQEKLNERWIPLFGEGSENLMICYDHVCFEDRAALVKEHVALYAGGLTIADEGREALGYAPRDEPESTRLYPPSGSTGGAAAAAGDMAVNQNQDRNNE